MKDTTTMVCFWRESLVSFVNNRWLVFVAAMWLQSCAGIGYLFGSISPVIKSSLSYNQRQVARLGVAKDLGDSVGFLAGSLCEVLPLWAALLVGAIQNLVGYGWVWLVVTGRVPALPLWAVSTTSIWIFFFNFLFVGFLFVWALPYVYSMFRLFVDRVWLFWCFWDHVAMWVSTFNQEMAFFPCLLFFIHHRFSWWFQLPMI